MRDVASPAGGATVRADSQRCSSVGVPCGLGRLFAWVLGLVGVSSRASGKRRSSL